MVASTCRDHVVVCGVGKVGYRVINELRAMDITTVGVDLEMERPYVQELVEAGVPIVKGNARLVSVLESAGIMHARALICVTSDDLANMDCAFSARELRADLRVVIRIFDDTIAKKMSDNFDLPAISTSYASAPAFVSQALGLEHSQSRMTIHGHPTNVQSIEVGNDRHGRCIGEIEREEMVKVIAYRSSDGEEQFPAPEMVVKVGGHMVILRRSSP